jgi:hypothetical protein
LFIAVPLCSKTNNELRNFPHLPSRHHRYEQKADATPFKLAQLKPPWLNRPRLRLPRELLRLYAQKEFAHMFADSTVFMVGAGAALRKNQPLRPKPGSSSLTSASSPDAWQDTTFIEFFSMQALRFLGGYINSS